MKPIRTLLLAVTGVVLVAASPASKQLSGKQAEALAQVVAEAELKGYEFGLDRWNQLSGYEEFYFFAVMVVGAQGHSGDYAVNKFTLEVWDPFSCSHYKGPELAKLQEKLRKELGITERQYRKHQKDDPCLAGEEHEVRIR